MGLKRGSGHDRLYDLYDDTTTTNITAHCMGFFAWLLHVFESIFSLSHILGFSGLAYCHVFHHPRWDLYHICFGAGVLKTDIGYRSKGSPSEGIIHWAAGEQRLSWDSRHRAALGWGSGRGAFAGALVRLGRLP